MGLPFVDEKHKNANSEDPDEMPQTQSLPKNRSSEKDIKYLFTL